MSGDIGDIEVDPGDVVRVRLDEIARKCATEWALASCTHNPGRPRVDCDDCLTEVVQKAIYSALEEAAKKIRKKKGSSTAWESSQNAYNLAIDDALSVLRSMKGGSRD